MRGFGDEESSRNESGVHCRFPQGLKSPTARKALSQRLKRCAAQRRSRLQMVLRLQRVLVGEVLLGEPELQGAMLLRRQLDKADADVAALVLPGDFRLGLQS